MYAVCQNGRCAQTYHLDNIIKGRSEEVFLKDIRITKGFRCEKCGSVVVATDGTATLSQNADIIKFIRVEELEEQKKRRYKEAEHNLKRAKKELKQLDKEYKNL